MTKMKKSTAQKGSQSTPKAKGTSTDNNKPIRLQMPEFAGISLSHTDLKDCEPLIHNDLHITIVQQAIEEWDASCLVVWTVGSGTPCLAGIMSETPTVGFVLNETHMQATAHLLDSTITERLLQHGNSLYDKELSDRVHRVINKVVASDSEADGAQAGTEKARKGKKRPAGDTTSSSAEGGMKKTKKHKKNNTDQKGSSNKPQQNRKSVAELLLARGNKTESGATPSSSSEVEEGSGADSDTSDST